MVAVTKFPRNPVNNQMFTDYNGIEWRYDAIRRRWVQNELNEEYPLASATQNGLVTPELYNRLVALQNSIDGVDLSTFKIAPGLDAYYYYFYSPDGLIDIRYRGNGEIAIDVNEQKLIAYYYRFLCIGDRGPDGDQGTPGEPGIEAPNEVIYSPTKSGNGALAGEVYVPTPIGTYYEHDGITPISLRFYGLYAVPPNISLTEQLNFWIGVIGNPNTVNEERQIFDRLKQKIIDQNLGVSSGTPVALSQVVSSSLSLVPGAILEIDVNPETNNFTIINNGVNANAETISINFDRDIGLLRFNIPANWPLETVFKARQRGPTGARGGIPDNFIRTENCLFPDDSNVRPDAVLTHLRLDCDNDVIYAVYNRLHSQDAFQLISTDAAAGGTVGNGPAANGRYAAVERIADPIKRTALLDVGRPVLEIDGLDLPDWQPQPGCHTKRQYANHEFNWVDETDKGTCVPDLTWYGPEGVRPSKYPYELIRPPEPEEGECCQDDYFIFPETGDC